MLEVLGLVALLLLQLRVALRELFVTECSLIDILFELLRIWILGEKGRSFCTNSYLLCFATWVYQIFHKIIPPRGMAINYLGCGLIRLLVPLQLIKVSVIVILQDNLLLLRCSFKLFHWLRLLIIVLSTEVQRMIDAVASFLPTMCNENIRDQLGLRETRAPTFRLRFSSIIGMLQLLGLLVIWTGMRRGCPFLIQFIMAVTLLEDHLLTVLSAQIVRVTMAYLIDRSHSITIFWGFGCH